MSFAPIWHQHRKILLFLKKTNRFLYFLEPESNHFSVDPGNRWVSSKFSKGKYRISHNLRSFLWCYSILELAIQCTGVVTGVQWWHTYRYPLSVWKKTFQIIFYNKPFFSFLTLFSAILEVSNKFKKRILMMS